MQIRLVCFNIEIEICIVGKFCCYICIVWLTYTYQALKNKSLLESFMLSLNLDVVRNLLLARSH